MLSFLFRRERGVFERLLRREALPRDETTFRRDILDWAARDPDSLSYAQSHIRRLAETLLLTPPAVKDQRALELGVYFHITPALKEILGYDEVRGAYFAAKPGREQKKIRAASGRKFKAQVDLFDVERDRFPYEDEYFSTVLCCELLEHLKQDPMHMMAEINRILPPDGYLVMTTPNIASVDSVKKLLAGANPGFFPQYMRPSTDGSVDPKHSREYTPSEIQLLVEDSGFEVIRLTTGDYGDNEPAPDQQVVDLLSGLGSDLSLRQPCIYCLARKVSPVRERYPVWLYA